MRALEEKHRTEHTIDTNVYLVGQRAREVLDNLHTIEWGLHDVDGTHTSVGGHRLHDDNIDSLEALTDAGVRNVAVTGRHQWQVEEVIANHPDRTPFKEWLIEQGFFRRTEDGTIELFEGTEAIAHNVDAVRRSLEPFLATLEEVHGIRFETTSMRGEGTLQYPHAHRTMYSIDALQHDGRKIDDSMKHEDILAHLTNLWRDHDPSFAIAKPGTSSTGTFEFTPDGLNKEGAVRRYLLERNVQAPTAAYFGDSGNDLPVFRGIPELQRFVIVNPHTKDVLIEHADVATVGIANAAPILQRMAIARRAVNTAVLS